MKKATLGAIVGFAYIILSRSVGTFWPGLFATELSASLNIFATLLSILALLLFYIMFYWHFTGTDMAVLYKNPQRMRSATRVAIAGMLILLLMYLESILVHFTSWNLPNNDRIYLLRLYASWLAAICALYFAAVFYDELHKKVSARLAMAAKTALIGASLVVVLRTYLLFNYYYSSQFKWRGFLGPDMPWIVVPVLLFIFSAQFIFLIALYREPFSEADWKLPKADV